MNDDYYNITTLEELRYAQCNSKKSLEKVRNNIQDYGNRLADSLSPSAMFSSAVGSVMTFISDATLVRKGYNLALSVLDKLFPDEKKRMEFENIDRINGK